MRYNFILRKKNILAIPIIIFSLIIFSGIVKATPTHLDKSKVPQGCRACHKGHGVRGTVLLEQPKDELCLKCHGAGKKHKDIYSQLLKPSNHPVITTARYHQPGEELPERNPSMPRHVSCYDCHNVHRSEEKDAIKGVRGYSGKGAKIKRLNNEYELCYNCHSDSANLPTEKNIALQFLQTNASFHPVETYGRNQNVPSLTRGYTTSSLIRCTDCHGNDEPTPKGPHGSIYSPLLKERYERTFSPESLSNYALCYQCHRRTSILSDESFKAHKIHIVNRRISCALCHNAHGSKFNPHLINFDTRFVTPNSKGELAYVISFPGKPTCLLTCHVENIPYEHKIDNTLQYCINTRCISNW
jgi:predicted CXXCH cytochrome family protein